MPKRWMAVMAAMLMAGCMPMELDASKKGSERACMAENARFLDAWTCVRARLAARQGAGASLQRDGLIEEGDLLAGQVKAGKVSDGDARKRLEVGLAHDAS